MRRPASLLALLAALAVAPSARGAPLVVASTPPRATLVCEGRVVGVTPVSLPRRDLPGCTLHHPRALPLWFDPALVEGPAVRFELPQLAAPSLPEAPARAPLARVAPRRPRGRGAPIVFLMEVQ